jgi:hypothetical protein
MRFDKSRIEHGEKMVRRSPASLVRMVKFLHNHYANDEFMRAKIESEVKMFAKTRGIDARGADVAKVKYL